MDEPEGNHKFEYEEAESVDLLWESSQESDAQPSFAPAEPAVKNTDAVLSPSSAIPTEEPSPSPLPPTSPPSSSQHHPPSDVIRSPQSQSESTPSAVPLSPFSACLNRLSSASSSSRRLSGSHTTTLRPMAPNPRQHVKLRSFTPSLAPIPMVDPIPSSVYADVASVVQPIESHFVSAETQTSKLEFPHAMASEEAIRNGRPQPPVVDVGTDVTDDKLLAHGSVIQPSSSPNLTTELMPTWDHAPQALPWLDAASDMDSDLQLREIRVLLSQANAMVASASLQIQGMELRQPQPSTKPGSGASPFSPVSHRVRTLRDEVTRLSKELLRLKTLSPVRGEQSGRESGGAQALILLHRQIGAVKQELALLRTLCGLVFESFVETVVPNLEERIRMMFDFAELKGRVLREPIQAITELYHAERIECSKLRNQIQNLTGSVRTLLWLTTPEDTQPSNVSMGSTTELQDPSTPLSFSRIFGPSSSISEVLDELIPLICSAFHGQDCCLVFINTQKDRRLPGLLFEAVLKTAHALLEAQRSHSASFQAQNSFTEHNGDTIRDILTGQIFPAKRASETISSTPFDSDAGRSLLMDAVRQELERNVFNEVSLVLQTRLEGVVAPASSSGPAQPRMMKSLFQMVFLTASASLDESKNWGSLCDLLRSLDAKKSHPASHDGSLTSLLEDGLHRGSKVAVLFMGSIMDMEQANFRDWVGSLASLGLVQLGEMKRNAVVCGNKRM